MWEAPSFSVQVGPQKGCAEMKNPVCDHVRTPTSGQGVDGFLGEAWVGTAAHLLHPDQGSAWAEFLSKRRPLSPLAGASAIKCWRPAPNPSAC